MRFEGTDSYVATQDLMMAVNAALALERPLLIKGRTGRRRVMRVAGSGFRSAHRPAVRAGRR